MGRFIMLHHYVWWVTFTLIGSRFQGQAFPMFIDVFRQWFGHQDKTDCHIKSHWWQGLDRGSWHVCGQSRFQRAEFQPFCLKDDVFVSMCATLVFESANVALQHRQLKQRCNQHCFSCVLCRHCLRLFGSIDKVFLSMYVCRSFLLHWKVFR